MPICLAYHLKRQPVSLFPRNQGGTRGSSSRERWHLGGAVVGLPARGRDAIAPRNGHSPRMKAFGNSTCRYGPPKREEKKCPPAYTVVPSRHRRTTSVSFEGE